MGGSCSKDDTIETRNVPKRRNPNKRRNDPYNGLSTPTGDPNFLGTPPSPRVIHARWGEQQTETSETVCLNFEPNPFKLGFCKNCMKQHQVSTDGTILQTNVTARISPRQAGKYAVNAAKNPRAVENMNQNFSGRESDVDLAALLRERQKVMKRLGMDQKHSASSTPSTSSTTKVKTKSKSKSNVKTKPKSQSFAGSYYPHTSSSASRQPSGQPSGQSSRANHSRSQSTTPLFHEKHMSEISQRHRSRKKSASSNSIQRKNVEIVRDEWL